MLYAYIDESYSSNGLHYLGALVVTKDVEKTIKRKLDILAEQISKDHSLPNDLEYHGYCIFHSTEDWEPLKNKHKISIGIYKKIMKIITESGGKLFIYCINEAGVRNRYKDPWPSHQIALQYLLEKINDYALRLNVKVIITADRVPDETAHNLMVQRYTVEGTPGYRPSKLENISLPIHWEDSKDHRNLQAIDTALYIYRRHHSHSEPNQKARKSIESVRQKMLPALQYWNIWP